MPSQRELTPEEVRHLLAGLLESLREELGNNLTSVALFGSHARGDTHEGSDVDVLLICRDLPRGQCERQLAFLRAVDRMAPKTEGLRHRGRAWEWAPVLKTEAEARYHSPLYLDMTEDAVLLYDRGGFLAGVLDEMRSRMRELGSRRVPLPDGSWYWDLKPSYRPGELVTI
jgi:predicted nucleotidyltransferase